MRCVGYEAFFFNPFRQSPETKASSSSDWQASRLNEKGSRTPEVVKYRRHCADDYEQAQGAISGVQK
jgi:hypothetical protein